MRCRCFSPPGWFQAHEAAAAEADEGVEDLRRGPAVISAHDIEPERGFFLLELFVVLGPDDDCEVVMAVALFDPTHIDQAWLVFVTELEGQGVEAPVDVVDVVHMPVEVAVEVADLRYVAGHDQLAFLFFLDY